MDSAMLAALVSTSLDGGTPLPDALAECVLTVRAGRLNLLATNGQVVAATTWGDTLSWIRRDGGVIGRSHKGGVGRLFRCGGSRRGDVGLIGGIAARVGQRSSGGRRGRLGIASGRRFDPNVLPYFQAGGIGQLVIVARRGSGRADCGERMRVRPRLIGRGQQNGQCD